MSPGQAESQQLGDTEQGAGLPWMYQMEGKPAPQCITTQRGPGSGHRKAQVGVLQAWAPLSVIAEKTLTARKIN